MNPESDLQNSPSQQAEPQIEQVRLREGLTVMSCDDTPRFRFLRDLWTHPQLAKTHLANRTTQNKVRALMDGAWLAGIKEVVKDASLPRPPVTLAVHVWGLINSYHSTAATPRVLKMAAARFEEMGRPDLAAYAYHEMKEETGHDKLCLNDLTALGLPALEMVTRINPPSLQAVAKYTRYGAEENPIGVFGYAYAVERSSSLLGEDYVNEVKAVVPPGVNATTTLIVHSSVGKDADHVQEMIEFVCGLPAADREQIIKAVYDSSVHLQTISCLSELTDEGIIQILAQHGFSLDGIAQKDLVKT